MDIFAIKIMKRVRRSGGVRESVGASWINIRSQGAGASVREQGLLKHTPTHTHTYSHTQHKNPCRAARNPPQTNPQTQQQVTYKERNMGEKIEEYILKSFA